MNTFVRRAAVHGVERGNVVVYADDIGAREVIKMSRSLTIVAFFSTMMAVQFIVVLFVFPETKGISLEQMEKKLGIV